MPEIKNRGEAPYKISNGPLTTQEKEGYVKPTSYVREATFEEAFMRIFDLTDGGLISHNEDITDKKNEVIFTMENPGDVNLLREFDMHPNDYTFQGTK